MSWFLVLMLTKTGDPYLRINDLVRIGFQSESACVSALKSIEAGPITGSHLVMVCRPEDNAPKVEKY